MALLAKRTVGASCCLFRQRGYVLLRMEDTLLRRVARWITLAVAASLIGGWIIYALARPRGGKSDALS
jgi:hypothetical protein